MGSALVLGGGGIAGVAWESGIVEGLRRGGVDLSTAEQMLGTSAGSIVGALVGQGADLEATTRAQADGDGPPAGSAGLQAVMDAFALLFDPNLSRVEARLRIGELALAADTAPEAVWIEALTGGLPSMEWPERLRVTAIDVATGELTAWDATSGVPLGHALAASCSVPCVFPPVSVNGSRYMDGGVGSSTNTELVAGAGTVVVLNPIAHMFPREPLQAELDRLAATGSAVLMVEPDAASVAAFGVDVLAQSLWGPAWDTGLAQGAALVAEVGAVWR